MAARTIYGLIGGGGEILSGSADFTVQRLEVGLYTVFFNRSFSAQPAVVVSQVYPSDIDSAGGNTLDNAVVVGITPERFRVKTGDPSGAASDRSFAFLAIGS